MEARLGAKDSLRFSLDGNIIDKWNYESQLGETTIKLFLVGRSGSEAKKVYTSRVLDFIEKRFLSDGLCCKFAAESFTDTQPGVLTLTVNKGVTCAEDDVPAPNIRSKNRLSSRIDDVDESDSEEQADDEISEVTLAGQESTIAKRATESSAAESHATVNREGITAPHAHIPVVNDSERRQECRQRQEVDMQQQFVPSLQLPAHAAVTKSAVTHQCRPSLSVSSSSSTAVNNRPDSHGMRKKRRSRQDAGIERLSPREKRKRYINRQIEHNPSIPMTRAQFDGYVSESLKRRRFGVVRMMKEFKIGWCEALAVYQVAHKYLKSPNITFAEPDADSEQESGAAVREIVACNMPAVNSGTRPSASSEAAVSAVVVAPDAAASSTKDRVEMDAAELEDSDIEIVDVVKRTLPCFFGVTATKSTSGAVITSVKSEQLDRVADQTFAQRLSMVRDYLDPGNGLRTRSQTALSEPTPQILADLVGFRSEREAFYFVQNYLKDLMPKSWRRLGA